jgi:sporulation protein YlmC with PRC-barrel domain
MSNNQFEDSRIASGTLNRGATKSAMPANGSIEESSSISRDDVRDGVANDSRSHRVLAATTLSGDRVRNAAGEDLGTIEEIMLDTQSGRIVYAVLSFGGFLGIGNKLFAVPWSAMRLDEGEHEFILDVDRATLKNAPGFDKDDWPDMAETSFAESVHHHYGAAPWPERGDPDAGDYAGDNLQRNRSIEQEPAVVYEGSRKQ